MYTIIIINFVWPSKKAAWMADVYGEWPSLENQVIDSQIFIEFPPPRGPRVKIFRGPWALYPFLTQKERMKMIHAAE